MGIRIKYVFVHDGKRSHREYLTARGCVSHGAAQVKRDADWILYHVGEEGEKVGPPRTLAAAKTRARGLLRNKPLGNTIRIAAKKSNEVVDTVYFHKVRSQPPVKDGPGVEGIDRAEAYVRANFPHARFAGDCVCKTTTSGSHSDHADCAAVDYFDSWENMSKMKNEFLSNAAYYHTKYVILGQTIYFATGSTQHYTGEYHSHVHLSVYGGVYNKAC